MQKGRAFWRVLRKEGDRAKSIILYCVLDFVGQNPMLVTVVDSDRLTRNAEIRLALIGKY